MDARNEQWFEQLLTPDGKTGRPAADGFIEVPEVRLAGDRLIWATGSCTRRFRPAAELLEEFVGLAESGNVAIERFAKRYGVLVICEHQIPASHNWAPSLGVVWPQDPQMYCGPQIVHRSFDTIRQSFEAPVEAFEDVIVWRALATEARAILRLSNDITSGRRTNDGDWQALLARDPFVLATGRPVPWWPKKASRRFESFLLSHKVNDWVEMGDLRVSLDWTNGPAPRVFFTSGVWSEGSLQLFAALALQLLLAVSSTKGFAVCSSCQRTFNPSRRPRADQRSYCDKCRERGAPFRDSKRVQRLRAKESKKRRRTRGAERTRRGSTR